MDVRINGVIYPSVPQVQIPKSDNTGDAVFYSTEGDTAIASDILTGKTAHTANGAVAGTMVNNGDVSGTISTKDGTVNVPSGYVSGGIVGIDATEKEKITRENIKAGVNILGVSGSPTVVDTTTTAGATAANIISGKHAFVNGQEITGTLTAVTVSQDSTTKVLSIS